MPLAELNDCILLPLRKLFNSTFTPMERLLLLLYLHKLLLHWIGVEYGRVLKLREGKGSVGAFGRADTGGSGLDGGVTSAAAVGDASRAPLAALAGLVSQWSDLAELGLIMSFTGGSNLSRTLDEQEGEVDLEGRRLDKAVFLNEVLTMFLVVSKTR